MTDAFAREYLGAPRGDPELVRRIAAYAYIVCEDFDRELNAAYGYVPRRDEVHPDAHAQSQRHAWAVSRGVALVAELYHVERHEVCMMRAFLRDLDDARNHYIPAGGQYLPDRLTRDLGRAVEHHVRAAFERRFDP